MPLSESQREKATKPKETEKGVQMAPGHSYLLYLGGNIQSSINIMEGTYLV
jgi:hypothetical protein